MTRRFFSHIQRAVPNDRSSHRIYSLSQAVVGLLVLIAIAFGGAVEAVACSPEVDASVSIAFFQDQAPAEDENQSGDQHAVCAHGHCHHGQQALTIPTNAAQTLAGSMLVLLSRDDVRTDTEPNLLKRPPRV
jgi:hypothetical protein